MRHNGALIGKSRYVRNKLGGGGYVTDIRCAGTGGNKVRVCRTDTMGAYIIASNDNGQWRLAMQAEVNVDESELKYNYYGGAGCYDIAVAPSNTNYIYNCQFGYIWRSADKGATWTRTALPFYGSVGGGNVYAYNANSSYRMFNERMNVDPANHLVVAFGHPDINADGGLKYTLDGGANWTSVSQATIPQPTALDRGMAVAFDPDSGTTSGRTNHVYVFSHGRGIYRSTTGITGAFTLITGSPTALTHMVVRNGVLWTCGVENDGGQMKKWTSGGGWSDVAGVTYAQRIAISPDGTKIIAMIPSSGYMASSNSGASFSTLTPTLIRKAVNIPWHETTNESYMSNGGVCWDTDTNLLYIAEGIGCWKCPTPPLDGTSPTYYEDSVGIENLVSMQILVLPSDGTVIYNSMDRNVFVKARADWNKYPSQAGVSNVHALDHGGCVDYCPGNESRLAVVSSNNGKLNISSNKGLSWTPSENVPNNVAATPPQTGGDGSQSYGGNISIGGTNNFVWMPTSLRRPSYTLDGGKTWNFCSFGGNTPPEYNPATPGDELICWHPVYNRQRITLISDKEAALTHYLYCPGVEKATGNGATLNAAYRGLWKSTDGGATFTRLYAGLIGPSFGVDAYHAKLRKALGQPAGHFFFCSGDVNADDQHANDAVIRFSPDEGATWFDLPGVKEPLDVVLGKGARGAAYHAIYAWGGLAGVRGLHRCTDFDPANPTACTWETIAEVPVGGMDIGRYPGGDFDSGNVLGADMQVFGLVYVGFGGSGMFRCFYDGRMRMV